MDITPFEQLKVTTMTLVVSLTNGVDIEAAYHLLPITRLHIENPRETAKCQLPHCEIPGSILSIRYCGNVRGIIRNKLKPFKNAVTLDISTKRKNISLKLSSYTIQMCGASSREDGVEAAEFLVQHLVSIQRLIDLMREDSELTSRTIAWLEEVTRGEVVSRVSYKPTQFNNIVLEIEQERPDNAVKCFSEAIPDIPEEFEPEIVEFLANLAKDFMYHSDFCRKLTYVRGLVEIINEPLGLKHVDEAMVNYNYSLGFQVDRRMLNSCMDGTEGFISRYNNALTSSVTIDLIYEPLPSSAIKRRKNKIPHHTFLVYRSGSVTQSGPGGELMKGAYYLFMNTIAKVREKIMMSDGTISRSSSVMALNSSSDESYSTAFSEMFIDDSDLSREFLEDLSESPKDRSEKGHD